MEQNIERNIANNLTELRKARELKQSDLSKEIGYSDKTISRWENGSSVPDITTLVKLAEFYNVTLEDLISENAVEKTAKEPDKKNKEEIVNELAVLFLSFCTVWLIGVLGYIGAIIVRKEYIWQLFVWAIPVSVSVLYYGVKKRYPIKWLIFLLYTIVVVGLIVAIYVQLLDYNFWQLFLIIVPLEGIGVVNTFYRSKDKKKKFKKQN